MKSTVIVLTGLLLSVALTSVPASAWQASADEHAAHHPGAQAPNPAAPKTTTSAPQATAMAGMNMNKLSNARLDELVKTMNAAQGQNKVDAIAVLLTALVQEHQGMHDKMTGMMKQHMGGGDDPGDAKK